MPVIRIAPAISGRIVRMSLPPAPSLAKPTHAHHASRLVDPRHVGRQSAPGSKRMANDTTSPYATYLSHLEKGELAYQFSPAANRAVFFPRLLCPYSGIDKLEWRVSKGRGAVYATTVVHPAEGAPYNVALVDCDEDFRLMSRVEDVAPDAVKIGMRVKFRVHKPGGENDPIPVFTPEVA